MVYVVDTHALLWYLFAPKKLGIDALDAFETLQNDDLLVVPAVLITKDEVITESGLVKIVW